MATQNPGTAENWITSTLILNVVAPKSGTTGTLEQWVTSTQPLNVYAETAASSGLSIPVAMNQYRQRWN
jgi:hypothetical protein